MASAHIEPRFHGILVSITGDRIAAGEFLIRMALRAEAPVLFFDPAGIYNEDYIRAQNPALAQQAQYLTVATPLKGGKLLPVLLSLKPSIVIASAADSMQIQELKAYARLHNAAAFIAGPGGDVEYAV